MVTGDAMTLMALKSASAGAVALAFGGAPLGVLMIARRLSLMGDALSHGILPGVAIAYIVAGRDPVALTLGALIAGLTVAGLSSLLARTGKLPDDAAFAIFYLTALALGVLLLGKMGKADDMEALLFGSTEALDKGGLLLAGAAASATLIGLALFLRGVLGEGADPVFMRTLGARFGLSHLLLMLLLALNLVAGFRAFGALMTVALMTVPAAAARFWAKGYGGQALWAIGLSAASGLMGLFLADVWGVEPGALMTLAAATLFGVSAIAGTNGGLLQTWLARSHLKKGTHVRGLKA
jgi:zinc/manganese transport system permease protein